MTLYKKGTCQSKTTISNNAYVCSKCGHTEVARKQASKRKQCPNCEETMNLVSTEEI